MARRVKQADGSYCYTENCRIHDRSGDSTGLQAVLNDAQVSRAKVFAQDTALALQNHLPLSDEAADRIAERVIDDAMKKDSGSTAYDIAESISLSAREEGITLNPEDNLKASYEAHTAIIQRSVIKQGDEVVLNETGERGVITEGDSFFGGAVRFNPESIRSRNSFAWFQPSDVTKLVANDRSLVREQVFAASRDSLVPAWKVKQMLDEETNKETRNAQGVKEVGRKGKVARENMLHLGDRIIKHYGSRAGMTKREILYVLNNEYHRAAEPGTSEAEVKATKSALRNIITSLDPTGDNRK